MRSRTVSVGAIVVASALALSTAACSSTGSTNSGSGGFTVSTSANSGRPGLEAIAPRFETDTGIKVSTQFGDLGTPTYTSQLLTQLQADSAPDVFSAFPGSGTSAPNMGTLAAAGNLLDLSSTRMAAGLPAATKPASTYDGKVYAAVLGVQFSGLIYNTELFEKHGLEPPRTFGDLLDVVRAIRAKAPDAIPLAFASGNSAVSLIVTSTVVVNQPGFTGNETTFGDSPAWRGALQQLLDLKQAGAFSASAPTDDANAIITQATSGKAFMVFDVTSRYAALKKANPSLPLSIVPYPAATADKTRSLLWPGTTLVVNAKTSHRDEAVKFIDYITTPDHNRMWTDAAGGAELPPAQFADKAAWPSQFENFKASAGSAVMIPAVSWPSAATGSGLGQDIPALLQGLKSPAQVLAAMDANWNK